ncbi:unnamed protein product [Cylicocyclus nassatus]|uniref:C-type lectin domain-containing protein n=1 Tax=Cylicocyclus nassatus TaxID=53992 RepID=A0AA36M7Q2_CYLNA|nr:unnamed protein product [Cylicocyclus nassatus]
MLQTHPKSHSMKFLLFAILPLLEAWPNPNSSDGIFRGSDKHPSLPQLKYSHTAQLGYCEEGWAYCNKTHACYKNFFLDDWDNAESRCIAVGGHLTSIHSHDENSFNFFLDDWDNAESRCIAVGGHLTSIHSHDENSFVAELARSGIRMSSSDQATWIGLVQSNHLNSNSTLEWIWIDGTEVDFHNWAPGEPGNQGGMQQCVMIASDPYAANLDNKFSLRHRKWNDYLCTQILRSFVCKKMAFALDAK